ncbi:MAG: hypothetical protein ACKVT2_09880 [Saprospiraceae bacterium]
MKKQTISLIISFLFVIPAQAQLENKGWWTRDLFTYRSDYDPDGGNSGLGLKTGRLLTQPEIGYALNKRCLLGLVTQYSHTFVRQNIAANSTGLARSDDRFFGAGPLFRYFIPLGKRVALMPEVFFVYYFVKKTEVNSILNIEEKSTSSYNGIGAGTFPSLVCFLTRDLSLSLTVASVQYYGNKNGRSLIVELNPQQWLLGVEYYFEKKKKDSLE